MNSVFGQSTGPSCSGNTSNEMGDFECNICFEFTEDPIVTLCGHLYCWPCLYRWLHIHSHFLEEEKLVPIYGRGKTSSDPRFRSIPGEDIPHRPAGQRPETAPPPAPDANYFRQEQDGILGGFMPRGAANYFRQEQDGILGVFMPRGAARVGNFTLSAAFGGLIPSFNLQVHGFNYANAYAPPTGFPYMFPGSFHGGHAHGFHHHHHHHSNQGQQRDSFMKMWFFFVGVATIFYLLSA